MPQVRIVTDSASDLPADLAASLAIVVIPLSLHFGPKTFLDGVDLSAAEFYRLLASDSNFPRTSQPSVGRFEEAYTRLRDDGAEIVSVHLSSKISGTFNAAAMAAKSVEGAVVHLVDSLAASMAIGEMAMAAARLAREGLQGAEIARQIEAMRGKLHVCIMLDSLTHLQRGGRIGRAQSMLGALLSVKPIISLEGGSVVPRQRVRTTARAVQEMAAEARKLAPLAGLRVLHSNAPKLVTELVEVLAPLVPGREIPSQLLGPVIGTHAGPGAVGWVALQE